MKQISASDQSLTRMLAWLNANIPSSSSPITTHQQLADGTAFLFLIVRFKPSFIHTVQIIQKPTTHQEVLSNLTLLAVSLQKIEPSFILDVKATLSQIHKLAEGEYSQVIRLLLFLFDAFQGDVLPKAVEFKSQEKQKKSSETAKTQSLSKVEPPMIEKAHKEKITEQDLKQLLFLKNKLQKIQHIIMDSLAIKSKMKSIAEVLTNPQIKQEEKNERNHPSFYHFTQQDIDWIISSKNQSKNKKKHSQKLMGTYYIAQKYLNHPWQDEKNHVFFHQIGKLTKQILTKISTYVKFSPAQLKIIENFSLVVGNVEGLDYLFFGRKPSPHLFRVYWIDDKEQNFEEERKVIRNYCLRFYQSSSFIKRLLYSHKMIMKSKITIIRKMDMVETFPQTPIMQSDLYFVGQLCLRPKNQKRKKSSNLAKYSQSFTENVKGDNHQNKLNMSENTKADYSSIKFRSQDEVIHTKCNNLKDFVKYESKVKLIELERKATDVYWSVHRRVLIATEVKFVYNKKPDFEDKESFDIFVNSKAHQRFEFDGGFLFPGKRTRIIIDFLKIIAESDKYPHLTALFRQDCQNSAQILRLREFIRIMLDLKHHSIIKEFMQIYDTIVGEIKATPFASIRKPSDRNQLIEKVIKMVQKGIGRISDYFVNTYDMPDSRLEVEKLLKVTVYCFLAEIHWFNHNEFYYEAFDFPTIDKKESTCISHFQKFAEDSAVRQQ